MTRPHAAPAGPDAGTTGRPAAPGDGTTPAVTPPAELRRHPVHGCDDREQHLRWAERWSRLRHDTDLLERRVEGKTHSIARVFDRVCALLEELGYLDGDAVTEAGRRLGRVYSEADLLVVESLREGLWDGLAPAELAAAVSTLVYESRRPDQVAQLPGGADHQVGVGHARGREV